jgi:hypothetical protein
VSEEELAARSLHAGSGWLRKTVRNECLRRNRSVNHSLEEIDSEEELLNQNLEKASV